MNELIRFGETAFPYLVDVVWQGTALMVIFFVLARFFRRKHQTARYWLWVYCLVGILLLPGISFLVRDHRLALLPAKEHIAVARPVSEPASPVSHVVDTTPMDEMTDAVSASEETRTPAPAEKPSEEPPSSEIAGAKGVAEASSTDSVQTYHPVVSAPIRETESPFPWRGCIALAWMAGCTVFLLRLAFAMVCIIRLRRAARPVEDSLVAESFEEVKGKAGISRRVALRIGRRVSSPVSIGIFRPTILLPESLVKEMPPEQLRPILLHELAHIRWGDYAVNLLQRLAQAVFFFHPLVYLVNRALRGLREEICDGWVLRHCPQATLYARALTTLAERWLRPRRSLLGVGLFNHRSRLSERIKRILGSGGRVPTAIRLKTALLLLAVSLCAVAALSLTTLSARAVRGREKSAPRKKGTAEAVEEVAGEHSVSWKEDTVYRDGKPYAKIVQWEPEADLPMTAFGDRNDNGETDTWIRFLSGKPLRIEIDGNEDGRIDRWEHYFDGVIDLAEQDTDFNRRVDVWWVFDMGKLFRKEIDENADGSVDRWLEVDEQGKLVEREIFSWTAAVKVPGGVGYGGEGSGGVVFFNARDRVSEIKKQTDVPHYRAAGPGWWKKMPPLRYWASTGSRIEIATEVGGRKMVGCWYHMPLWDNEVPHITKVLPPTSGIAAEYPLVMVRHSAVDWSLDGGVDSWGQARMRVYVGMARRVSESLLAVYCDDRNRDGKADRCRIELRRNPVTRHVETQVETKDSNGDGLVEWYQSESLGHLVDTDHDGVLDSFPEDRRAAFPNAEPVGSSVLRLRLESPGGKDPTPLLCEFSMHRDRQWSYVCQRALWISSDETTEIVKLRGGTYDLAVSMIRPETEPDSSESYSESVERRTTRFFLPAFLAIRKGETVSKILSFDLRPVFRGRLICNDIMPLGGARIRISLKSQPIEWLETTSDNSGDFELFNMSPGECLLSVSIGSRTYATSFKHRVDIPSAAGEMPDRFVIPVPLERGGLRRISLPAVPEGWEAPLAMHGKVLSHDGEALSNMRVVVTTTGVDAPPTVAVIRRPPVPTSVGARSRPPVPSRGLGTGSQGERMIRRDVVTAPDGSYRILALSPGTYQVWIYNNDFARRAPEAEAVIEIEKTPMKEDFRLSGPMMPGEER